MAIASVDLPCVHVSRHVLSLDSFQTRAFTKDGLASCLVPPKNEPSECWYIERVKVIKMSSFHSKASIEL